MEESRVVLRTRERCMTKETLLNILEKALEPGCWVRLSEAGDDKSQFSVVVIDLETAQQTPPQESWGYYTGADEDEL